MPTRVNKSNYISPYISPANHRALYYISQKIEKKLTNLSKFKINTLAYIWVQFFAENIENHKIAELIDVEQKHEAKSKQLQMYFSNIESIQRIESICKSKNYNVSQFVNCSIHSVNLFFEIFKTSKELKTLFLEFLNKEFETSKRVVFLNLFNIIKKL